jgi:hypothetical protein
MNDKSGPHTPAEYDEKVIMAVRAFHEGKASRGQQMLFRYWLLNAVCRVDDMSFRIGGEDGRRATDFAEGKRYVANQYRKMLNPITLAATQMKRRAGKRRGKTAEANEA